MKLITNSLNNNYLQSYLPPKEVEVDGVYAAIAYGNHINEKLIDSCVSSNYRLDIWMRYDHTVPVTPELLKKFLKYSKANIFCKLIPDVFHSKVIWWKGYGAYIGSANLTDRAWNTNIETGIYIDDGELISTGMHDQLEEYFEDLNNLDEAIPLTEEIIREMETLQRLRKEIHKIDEKCKQFRKISVWNGLAYIDKGKVEDKRQTSFNKEWMNTIQILRNIASQIVDYRPEWIEEHVPPSWQADQFLHAYYYNKVKNGREYPYEEFHKNNMANPAAELQRQMEWWRSLKDPPSNENYTLKESAPFIRDSLNRDNLRQLTFEKMEKIFGYTHATNDHLVKMKLSDLGVFDIKNMSRDERIKLFTKYIMSQKNKKNHNIIELIKYVLYDGRKEDISERIYTAARNGDYKIRNYGLNSIAELAGWALPEVVPPRNGRTSKALRAFGFPVNIY